MGGPPHCGSQLVVTALGLACALMAVVAAQASGARAESAGVPLDFGNSGNTAARAAFSSTAGACSGTPVFHAAYVLVADDALSPSPEPEGVSATVRGLRVDPAKLHDQAHLEKDGVASMLSLCNSQGGGKGPVPACVRGSPAGHAPSFQSPAWLVFDLAEPVAITEVVLEYVDTEVPCAAALQLMTSGTPDGPWEVASSVTGGCGMGASGALTIPLPPDYVARYWKVDVAATTARSGGTGGPVALSAVHFHGCEGCDTCPHGHFLAAECSSSTPRKCSKCTATPCADGWFESGPCSPRSDRSCAACASLCPPRHFAIGTCTGASDVTCSPCPPVEDADTPSACVGALEFPLVAESAPTRASTVCVDSEYLRCGRDGACGCVTCRGCGADALVAMPCTATIDTQCTLAPPLVYPTRGVAPHTLTVSTGVSLAAVGVAVSTDGSDPTCANAVRGHSVALVLGVGVTSVKAVVCTDEMEGLPASVVVHVSRKCKIVVARVQYNALPCSLPALVAFTQLAIMP